MAPHKWSFEADPDVFVNLVDLQDRYKDQKVTTQPSLGLVPKRPYPSDDSNSSDKRDWVRFATYVRWLNKNSPENVKYKVLYLTRHGFGYHNKLHVEVGDEAWQRKWAFEYGNDKETWFDAHLTEVGIQQAKDLNVFWTNLIDVEGAPLPESLYTSPLARCLQTTHYIFRPLYESHSQPFRPVIKEAIREQRTMHKCDYRRTRSWIAENYPDYTFEDGFAEEDYFANESLAETDEQHVERKHGALEDVWESDDNEFIAMTVHSFAIKALQAAVGLEPCKTREGTSLAILVKGEKKQ